MNQYVRKLRLGIVVPDRGDRPEFMAQCERLIKQQTVMAKGFMDKEPVVLYVNYPPKDDKVDITPRYKMGYEWFKENPHEAEVIAFMENDDWYAPDYLEYMLSEWLWHKQPPLFGTQYTIYYHIRMQRYYRYHHFDRASMMNTIIRNHQEVPWPPDEEPFTDAHIWLNMKGGVTFHPVKHYSLGIKHGIGKCGGPSHTERLHRYNTEDGGLLKSTVDPESYEFYKKFLGT